MSVKLKVAVSDYNDPDLRPFDRAVLDCLLRFCKWDGSNIYPSMRKIAQQSNLSLSCVNRRIQSLINKGFLILVKRGSYKPRRANVYRINTEMFKSFYPSVDVDKYCISGGKQVNNTLESMENMPRVFHQEIHNYSISSNSSLNYYNLYKELNNKEELRIELERKDIEKEIRPISHIQDLLMRHPIKDPESPKETLGDDFNEFQRHSQFIRVDEVISLLEETVSVAPDILDP